MLEREVAEKPNPRRIKKTETVRDKAAKSTQAKARAPRRVKKIAKKAAKPTGRLTKWAKKEYYLPLPDNRLGRFLNKPRRLVPRYFRESWQELKRVNWPTAKETVRLTFAVFVFALFFGALIAGADYILDIIFRRILL